jgi:3-oxoadipate enol-lactonase
MPFATVNGARLYYEQHGQGPDIVFLHGAGGNHLSWWQQIPALQAQFRCTVFDARGWGLSTGEMTLGRFVFGTDLAALLDHLGIKRAHIVAQSMGGRAVAWFARRSSERIMSLVLSGTTAGATNDRVRELQDELRERRGPGGLRKHSLGAPFERSDAARAALYRQIANLNPPRPKGLLGRPPSSYRGSMHEHLSDMGVPIMFAVGELDLITSPEMVREAHALVRGSVYVEFEGAGHSAYFERPDEFNRALQDFLGRSGST